MQILNLPFAGKGLSSLCRFFVGATEAVMIQYQLCNLPKHECFMDKDLKYNIQIKAVI